MLERLTRTLAGFRPPLSPDPFESLVTSITAQQVSLHAAFAIRNRLHPALRPAGRRRLRVSDREAPATGEPRGSSRARLLQPQGRVRARPCHRAGRPARARRASRRGGEGAPRHRPGARGVDRGLVPRTAPRAPAGLAGGRPCAAEGGARLLPGGRGHPRVRSALRPVPEPDGALPPDRARLPSDERPRSDRRRRAHAARLHRGDLRRELGPAVAPAGGHARRCSRASSCC